MASDLDRLLVEALQGGTYTPTPENVKNVVPAPLAGMLGAPGDIQAMAQWAGNKLAPLLAKQPGGDLIGAVMGMAQGRSGPTTEELGAVLGADPNSPEFQVASFGAPDMSDVGRFGLAQALLHASKDFRPAVKGMTNNIRDLFDMRFVGDSSRGEGATAYGWGLYFAESPDTVKHYKHKFSRPGGPMPRGIVDTLKAEDYLGFSSASEAMRAIRSHPDWAKRWDISPGAKKKITEYLDSPGGATMFEADIPRKVIDQMLDWDAPLSKQPDKVKEVLQYYNFPEHLTGKQIYKKIAGEEYSQVINNLVPDGLYDELLDAVGGDKVLADKLFEKHRLSLQSDALEGLNSEELASRALNQAGIPGIRFLDGASRKAGEGTRNIVVFDPEIIRSVKRNDELVYENTDLAKALRDGK